MYKNSHPYQKVKSGTQI